MAGLEQSQRILEDFAELADLGCAHGSFFAWRGEVIIDALFQIPLQKLDALMHADFFRLAPAGLMQLLELNDLTHTSGQDRAA